MIGSGSIAGLATEVTYGTYVASSRWCPFTSSSLNAQEKLESPGHLFPSSVQVGHTIGRDLVHVGTEVGGDLEIVPTYDHESFSVLLRHAFAAEPVKTGTGPYTYTYELGSSRPGLSVQQLDGTDAADTDLARRFTGCVCTSWEFSLSAGGFAKFKSSWIAQNVTDPQALAGTPAVANGEEIVAGQGAGTGITWNSLNLFATDFAVKVDHKLVRTPFIGSYLTGTPAPSDMGQITVTAKVYSRDKDLMVSYHDKDRGDIVLALTGGTSPNALTITAQEAVLTKCDRNVDTAGIIYYACEWRCQSTANTKTGIKFVLVNSNSDWV
jgi:hypothetical protein